MFFLVVFFGEDSVRVLDGLEEIMHTERGCCYVVLRM